MHHEAEYQHRVISVSYGVDMAVEQGSFTVNWTRQDDSECNFTARSITHWEKNSEGVWKIRRFIFNAPSSS